MYLQPGVSIRPFICWFLWHPLCYRWWLSLYVRKHSHYTPCPFSLFLDPIPHCLPRRTEWMFALRSSFDHFKVQTNNCVPTVHFWFACSCGTGVSVFNSGTQKTHRLIQRGFALVYTCSLPRQFVSLFSCLNCPNLPTQATQIRSPMLSLHRCAHTTDRKG